MIVKAGAPSASTAILTDREGSVMPQKAWSAKRERQYAHVNESLLDQGKPRPLVRSWSATAPGAGCWSCITFGGRGDVALVCCETSVGANGVSPVSTSRLRFGRPVVVIWRDWLTNLDRDVMPAVREGEESLCKEYDKALQNDLVSENESVAELLKTERPWMSPSRFQQSGGQVRSGLRTMPTSRTQRWSRIARW